MGRMMFGRDEKLTCVVDVKLQGGSGEPLCLAYKTTIVAFVAPLYLRKDGWVLGVKERPTQTRPDRFYPLPGPDEVKELQRGGLLPDPLPPYRIPALDYAFGYLLWEVILLVAQWSWVERLVKRRRMAAALPGTEQQPPPDEQVPARQQDKP